MTSAIQNPPSQTRNSSWQEKQIILDKYRLKNYSCEEEFLEKLREEDDPRQQKLMRKALAEMEGWIE